MVLKIKGKVSSDIAVLDELSASYSWIPNFHTIRPTPEVLAYKLELTEEINTKWKTFKDYILFRVYGKDFQIVDNKFCVLNHELDPNIKVFQPNEFAYNIQSGQHWVLWYGSMTQECTDEEITKDIDFSLRKMHPDENYDFAWYVNPKMSVPDLFHVQVFWTKLT
jgi:hypothetical protein